MSTESAVPPDVEDRVTEMVEFFRSSEAKFRTFRNQIQSVLGESDELLRLIHSMRGRIKDPDHLRHKLLRKWIDCVKKERNFDYSTQNLFVRVNDLVGFRVLHLHTRQFAKIHEVVLNLFREHRLDLVEEPFARTWDDESRAYFKGLGLETPVDKPSLYTSVHYVFKSNSKTELTAELQVRTLAEELWGEVDHFWNYPQPTTSIAISEQIAALARATSGCSRLVDSIFATGAEIKKE